MDEDENAAFARRLLRLRKRAALSQRDLARLAGINPATVNRLEAGQHEAIPSTIRALARALKVPPSSLTEGEFTIERVS